jgi:uncharacterized protein YjbI with pentapeptide repeats
MAEPADDLLRSLGFEPARGPGPGGVLGGSRPWWDLRECNLRERIAAAGGRASATGGVDTTLTEMTFRRVCFGDRTRARQPTDLTGARFERCRFEAVTFVNVPLNGVYLRNCSFEDCDFRYTQMRGTSFQESGLVLCDFYRAFFEAANVFTDATLSAVSFDKAWLSGITGLSRETFGEGAMAQECGREVYQRFLATTAGERPPSHSLDEALEQAPLDAAEVYRSLSGMWTAQGQLRDAGFAYERCKQLERRFCSPSHSWTMRKAHAERNRQRAALAGIADEDLNSDGLALKRSEPEDAVSIPTRTLTWLRLTAWWAIADFGESMGRVMAWLALLIVVPGVAFSLWGGVQTDAEPPQPVHSLWRCILFSFQQLTTLVDHLQSSNSLVDLVGSTQVFLGVTLLGLLGFTVANRLRNS